MNGPSKNVPSMNAPNKSRLKDRCMDEKVTSDDLDDPYDPSYTNSESDDSDNDGWTVLYTQEVSIEEVWQRLHTSLTLDEFKAVLEEQKYKKTWAGRFGQIWWWVQTFGLLGSHVTTLQHTRTVIYLLLEYLVT